MKTVESYNFKGKKALIRVDLNVPLNEAFQVGDLTRINATVPTIKKIIKDGGSAILMSHLGRPKSGPEEKFSLKHVVPALKKAYETEVKFVDDCIGEKAELAAKNLKPGEVLLLDNVRFYKEETAGDEAFAKKLSVLGDVYVNDAFGTAHRAHASTTVVAQYFEDKMAGYVMKAEIENAQKVLDKVEKPYVAIMGGAKISDKILIIERLLDKVDYLLVGGGMSYTFFKAMGASIGNSLVEEDKVDLAKELIEKAKSKGVELMLPSDSVVAKEFNNDAERKVTEGRNIDAGWMGLDIGPKTIQSYAETIRKCKTILWNGPMGVFEMSNFAKGTIDVAEAVVAATASGSFSLIGGGDSAAAVNNLGYGDKVSYVSTGGGALLEYMEGKVLPGVAALEK